MSWQKQKAQLYREECSVIRRRLPDVDIVLRDGRVSAEGPFPVVTNNGPVLRQYLLGLVFPADYPNWVPTVAVLEPGVRHIADRHIFRNGVACLCLPHEIPLHLPDGIRVAPFLDKLLAPWLIGQAHYDEHGEWPFKARSHNRTGLLEGISELLGVTDTKSVERYARLLVRKNPAKGHEPCPCGSGRKLRDCHSALYRNCRDALPSKAMRMYPKQFL